jgi:hypothetical protein
VYHGYTPGGQATLSAYVYEPKSISHLHHAGPGFNGFTNMRTEQPRHCEHPGNSKAKFQGFLENGHSQNCSAVSKVSPKANSAPETLQKTQLYSKTVVIQGATVPDSWCRSADGVFLSAPTGCLLQLPVPQLMNGPNAAGCLVSLKCMMY